MILNSLMLRNIVFLLICVCSLFAQSPTATLVGRIQDPSGASVPGARVDVTNSNTAELRSASSNADGEFAIPNLRPGSYDVAVEAAGFRAKRETGLTLQVDQTARLDVQLSVGSQADSIEVKADMPLLNTENASKGDVVVNEEITEMPLAGRSFGDLALLVPGVAPTAEGGHGSPFAVNGARSDNTNFVLDGLNTQNPRGGNNQVNPPLDAMQEFKMQTTGFSAEYGRLAGGVMSMVLKTGGNRLHGSLSEFLRNDVLDARDFFSADKQPLRRNQFGVSLDGPVVLPKLYDGRNRTFFLFTWGVHSQQGGLNQADSRSRVHRARRRFLEPSGRERSPGPSQRPAGEGPMRARRLRSLFPRQPHSSHSHRCHRREHRRALSGAEPSGPEEQLSEHCARPGRRQ